MRPPSKDFSRINRIKDSKNYFYSFSVNYNNRLPTSAMMAETALIAVGGPS